MAICRPVASLLVGAAGTPPPRLLLRWMAPGKASRRFHCVLGGSDFGCVDSRCAPPPTTLHRTAPLLFLAAPRLVPTSIASQEDSAISTMLGL